jgi:hypothetical protein
VTGRSSVLDHRELSQAIRVRQFQTPLEDAMCFAPHEAQKGVRCAMDANHFDFAPVQVEGQPMGYVVAGELNAADAAPVAAKIHPIVPADIVSADAPFHDLLRWLGRTPLFVLEGHRLTGFVTPSDANKQAARSYFYLLVAEVELGLASLIRDRFKPSSAAAALLSEDRRCAAENRMAKDRRRNLDSDVVSYFDFCDLLTVAAKTPSLRIGSPSRTHWEKRTGELVDFRNWVMHPTRGLTCEYPIDDLISIDDSLTELAEAIWGRANANT